MISNLPEGWGREKLSDITNRVKVGFVGSCSKYYCNNETGIPMIRTTNLSKSGVMLEGIKYITEEFYEKNKKSQLKRNDILIARHGSNGLASLWDKNIKAQCLNVIVVETNDNLCNPVYLTYAINSKIVNDQILSMVGGSVQGVVNTKSVAEVLIPYPILNEQKAIANTLSALDDKIELNNKINENLEKQAQAIFKHWFIDFEFPDESGNTYKSSGGEMIESELGMIPKGWEVVAFENVIEFSNGYGFKSKELLESPVKEGYRVFKMGDIKVGGGLNPNKTKSWISLDYLKENKLESYVAKKGDLLMCMTDMKNNMKLLGHTALMPIDDEYVVNQRVGHIREKNDIDISYPYLYILTNNDKFIDDLRGRSNSGVQVNLTTTAIKETKTIVGNKDINLEFDKIARPMLEKIFLLEAQNQKLSQLRDTLLPKLMSGELRIPLD